jgi:hypothetical protein
MISPVPSAASTNSPATLARTASAPTETKAAVLAKKDQVDISKLAQKLATDGDTQGQEASESGAERSSETSRGKK